MSTVPTNLVVDQCWTVEGNIVNATPVWFNNNANMPSGWYRVAYVQGAMRYFKNFGWCVDDINTQSWMVVTSVSGAISDLVAGPCAPTPSGPSIPNHTFSSRGWDTQEAAENASKAIGPTDFFHNGGPLGMRLYDNPYTDNVHGAPDPTWSLCSLRQPTTSACDELVLFNSGTTTAGVIADGKQDTNWILIQSSDTTAPGPAVYVSAAPLNSNWPANTNNSKWIGPKTASQYTLQTGLYTYRYQLDLTNYDPTTATITGRWIIDDQGVDIKVNGVSSGQVNNLGASSGSFQWANFSLSHGFIQGVNTIDFITRNVPSFPTPTGLRVEWISGNACSKAAPPPLPPPPPPGSGTTPISSTPHTGTVSSGSEPPPECTKETPTTGLLPAKFKSLLDSLPSHPGGFGFIFKPGTYLTLKDGPDSILTGDVTFSSETLDISCAQSQINGSAETIFTFKVGQDFLSSFCLNIRGLPGDKGDKGSKGPEGRSGTGDGPQGDQGPPGINATIPATFTDVQIIDIADTYDTAVVSLDFDPATSTLEIVKAKMAVPDSTTVASLVSATALYRDVTFDSSNSMDNWNLFAPSGDPVSTITSSPDLDIIKLPDGWNGAPIGVATMKLSQLVTLIVNYYNNLASGIVTGWDRQIKEYIAGKDQDARQIVADLAQELTEAEWSAPIEFGIDIQPLQCNPST